MATKVRFDPEADALMIRFDTAAMVEGEEVYPNVVLHFDTAGRIVGIEVLHASKTLSSGALAHLSASVASVGAGSP
ncbi:MAG TPA: DUF2283 domain-containing protein [Acetobacteraceae bacterium]|jgi:uncharacterized protein YuzE